MRRAIVILLCMATSAVHAQTFQTTGNWSDASKWASSNIGDAITENVTINASRTATVQNTESYTIGNLSVNNTSRIIINAGGTLTVGASGNNKNINGASADNVRFDISGVLEVWGNFTLKDNARLNVLSGGQLIVHGNFAMSGDFQAVVNGSVTVTGTTSFTDTNATLTGSGSWSTASCSPSGSSFCNDGQILPVELEFFRAHAGRDVVHLSWATATELNFDYFALERSADGVQFEEIGQLQGHGTTRDRHEYSFDDNLPLIGKSYYRVSSVDFDGFTEIFDAVVVEVEAVKEMQVYPNPVTAGEIHLKLGFAPSGAVRYRITDLSGAVQEEGLMEGRMYSISTNLSRGTYLLSVHADDFLQTCRVVVR